MNPLSQYSRQTRQKLDLLSISYSLFLNRFVVKSIKFGSIKIVIEYKCEYLLDIRSD